MFAGSEVWGPGNLVEHVLCGRRRSGLLLHRDDEGVAWRAPRQTPLRRPCSAHLLRHLLLPGGLLQPRLDLLRKVPGEAFPESIWAPLPRGACVSAPGWRQRGQNRAAARLTVTSPSRGLLPWAPSSLWVKMQTPSPLARGLLILSRLLRALEVSQLLKQHVAGATYSSFRPL